MNQNTENTIENISLHYSRHRNLQTSALLCRLRVAKRSRSRYPVFLALRRRKCPTKYLVESDNTDHLQTSYSVSYCNAIDCRGLEIFIVPNSTHIHCITCYRPCRPLPAYLDDYDISSHVSRTSIESQGRASATPTDSGRFDEYLRLL